jgi:hypothetical protein
MLNLADVGRANYLARVPKSDDEYDKQVDLEPTEYTYKGKHEPAFGPGAKPMLIMFAIAMVLGPVISRIVNGQWPYWVRPWLE